MNKLYKYVIYSLLIFPALIFFTDLTRNPYYFQIFLLNVLILGIWSIFLLQSAIKGKIKWAFSPIDLPLFILIIIAFLSFLIAYLSKQNYHIPEIIEEGKKLQGVQTDYLKSSIFSEGTKKLIFTLVNLLMSYLLTSVLIPVLSNSKDEKEKFYFSCLRILFLVGFVAASYGILQYFGIELIWPRELNPFGGRPVSTFGNPNFMSSYLVILIPLIAVHLILKKSSGKKMLYVFLLLVYFSSILATLTRSSWVGFFVASAILIFYFFFRERAIFLRESKWIFAIVILFFLFFILWPKPHGGNTTTLSRIIEIKTAKEKSYGPLHQRILIWASAWQMVKEKPLLGKGWGLFELFYPFYQNKGLFNELYRGFRTHANNAHNEIFEYWSQVGTVGFATYIWFLVCFFVYGNHLLKNTQNENKFLLIGIIAGTAGMIFDNIFGNVSTQFCVPAFLYWWNIGMLCGFDNTRKIYEYNLTKFARILFLIAVVFFSFLIYRWYHFFAGEINYFKGFKLSKRGDVRSAIYYLEKAHYHNREVNSEYELANCYARTNQQDKAIWAYYQALCANCGYDEIHFNLATVYAQKGDIENAILNYTQSLFINPISRDAYHALGNIFLTRIDKYLNQAEILFSQAVFFFPENIDFWNILGYVYTKKDENSKAIECYRKAVQINPDFELAKHNLKVALSKAGIKNDPILEYEELLRLTENKIQEKNWQEVLNLSKKLVKILPNSFKGHFYLANSLFTLGNLDEAIEEYKESLKISKDNLSALTNLGFTYIKKNDLKNAKETFEKILQIDPQNKTAQEQLNLLRSMNPTTTYW